MTAGSKEDNLPRNVRWRAALWTAAAGALVTLGSTATAYAQSNPPDPTAPCGVSQLDAAINFRGAAAGNRYAVLVVTNKGAECTLQGHPGLQLVAVDGRLLGTRVDPRDIDPVPPAVTLPTSASATSELHWIVGPCGTEGDDGTAEARPAAITVSVPGSTDGITLSWPFGAVCGEPEGPAEIDASAFTAQPAAAG